MLRASLIFSAVCLSGAAGVLYAIADNAQTTGAVASPKQNYRFESQLRPAILTEPNRETEGRIGNETAPVVFLTETYKSNERRWSGTAFLLQAPSGQVYIVTNRHVCIGDKDAAKEPTLYILRQDQSEAFATVMLIASENSDLCLLRAPEALKKNRKPLTLEKKDPELLSRIRIFGHPRARSLERFYGEVMWSAKEDPRFTDGALFPDGRPFLFMYATAHSEPGSSGSPVLNDNGKVVGVVFATADLEGHTLFIPVTEVNKLITQHESKGKKAGGK